MASHDPSQDQPADQTPGDPTPQPKRTSIGTDPTMPISWRRPQPEPVPEVQEPAADADGADQWSGSEQTLVGMSPAHSSESDRQPIVVVDDDSSNWIGAEKTAIPTGRPGDAGDEDDSSWLGKDQTLVGGALPARPATT